MRAKISHVNVIIASLVFVLSFALLFSPSTFAVDFSIPVEYAERLTIGQIYFCTDASLNNMSYEVNPGGYCYGSSTKRWARTGIMRIEAGGSTNNWAVAGVKLSGLTVNHGNYVSIPFYISSNAQAMNFITQVGLIPRPSHQYTMDHIKMVGTTFENYDAGGYRMTLTFYVINDINQSSLEFISDATDAYTATGSNPYAPNFWWSRGISTAGIVAGTPLSFYNVGTSSGGGSYDDSDVLSYLGSIYNKLDEISDNSVNATATEILDAVQSANDDANERYQDEKDTIQNSVDDAADTADSLDTSGFSISNPFTNFFALFTDNTCVSIPTIKGWLHSTESQVCSPWSGTNVRTILTPVFSLLSTLLIIGFVIRWLSSGNKEGTIEGI